MDPTRRAMLNEFGRVKHAVLQSPQHNTVHVIYGHTNKHFVHSQLTEELKTRTGLQLVPPQSGGALASSPADSVLIVVVDWCDLVIDRSLRQAVEASGHPDTRTLFIQKDGLCPGWVKEKLPRSTLLLYPDINWDSRLYDRNTSITGSTSSLALFEEKRKVFWDNLAIMIGDPDMDPTRRAMLNDFGLVQHAVLQSPQHNTVHVIYDYTNRHFVHSQLTEELKTRTGLQLVPPQSGGAMAPSPADSVLIVIVDRYYSVTDRLLRQSVEASGHPDTRTLFIKKEGFISCWVDEKLPDSTLLLYPDINRVSRLYGRNTSIPESASSLDFLEFERKAFWDNLSVLIGKLSQKRSSVQPSKRMLTSSVDGHHKSEPTSTPLYKYKPWSASTCEEDCRTDHTLAPTEDLKLEHPDMSVVEDGTKANDDRTYPSHSEENDFQCCYCSCDSLSTSPNSSDSESGSEASSSDSASESKERHQYTQSGSGGSPERVDLDLPSPDVSLSADKPVPDLPSPERVDLDLPSPERVDLDLPPPERVDLDLPSPERVDLDLPPPVCSPAWQASSLFTRHGGCLRKPGSDVILHVPPGAVNSDSGVVIRAAVCADVARIRRTLRLSDDEQVVSPLAEFWAGSDFKFDRPVSVPLHLWLPANADPDLVRVYHVTSTSSGHVDCTELHRQSDTTCPTPEAECFRLDEDQVTVFTDHFSGFVCTYCHKKGKNNYRPELYLTASGSISPAHDSLPPRVDVYAYVWDKRIMNETCRQAYGIREFSQTNCIELLTDLRHSKLQMGLRKSVDLTHRLDSCGQPLYPGETKEFDLMSSFGCRKCAIQGKQLPKSHQWALQFPPGDPAVSQLEFAVHVTHYSCDNKNPEQAVTTLLLTVRSDQTSITTQTDWSESDDTPVKQVATETMTERLLHGGARSKVYTTPCHPAASNGDACTGGGTFQPHRTNGSNGGACSGGGTFQPHRTNGSNGDACTGGGTFQPHDHTNGSTASSLSRGTESLCPQNGAVGLCHVDTATDTTRGRLVPAAGGGQLDSLLGARFNNCSITINANNNTHNNNVNKLGKMNTGNVSHYNAHSGVEAMDYPQPQSHQPGDIPMVEMPGDTSLQESQQEIEDPED